MLSFLKNLKEKHDLKTLLLYSSWAITLTSGLSYVLGYVRDGVMARTFGLSTTLDIYKTAFTLPEMLQNILIVAALSAGFVPIFMKSYEKNKQAGYVYGHQIMSWGVTILLGVIILAAIFLPYFAGFFAEGFSGAELDQYIAITRVLLITTLIFGISTILGQVLISIKEFFWYGLAPVLNNLGVIFGIFFLSPRFGLMGIVWGAVLGAFLHLLIRLIVVKRRGYQFKLKPDYKLSPEMKETFWLAYPKIPQYALEQIRNTKFASLATTFATGSASAHDLAFNFKSMPVSFLGIAIALAMFPILSHDAGKGNFEKFKQDFKKNRFRAIFYTLLAAGLMAIFSTLMIRILFGGGEFGESEVRLLAGLVMVYCIAIPFESLLHIYHRAFYSLKNTLIPSLMHCVTLGVVISGAYLLAPHLGLYCLPVSFAVGHVLHILVLSSVFPILLKRRELAYSKENKD